MLVWFTSCWPCGTLTGKTPLNAARKAICLISHRGVPKKSRAPAHQEWMKTRRVSDAEKPPSEKRREASLTPTAASSRPLHPCHIRFFLLKGVSQGFFQSCRCCRPRLRWGGDGVVPVIASLILPFLPFLLFSEQPWGHGGEREGNPLALSGQ